MARNKTKGFALNSIHDEVTFPIRQVRQPMSLNLFKCQLLGDRHIPAAPQTEEVLSALSDLGMEVTLDPRTWRGWFGSDARRARGDSLNILDKAAMKLSPSNIENDLLYVQPELMFFSKMMEGGLCKELLEPSASKRTKYALIQRADEYMPLSPWHLHLDAIEVVALAEGNGSADWETVKLIGASKVLQLLHDRWNARDGSIYSTLCSNFRIEYELACDSEKEQMRRLCAQMKPDIFPHLMRKAATPDFSRINVAVDLAPSQVHKLLFCLAADENFLVADRFDAWALDLASAALTTLARAMTDRYNNFGPTVGPDLVCWDAYDTLFFRDEQSQDLVVDTLCWAMESLDVRFSMGSIELLMKAGAKYRLALSQLGVSLDCVQEMTARCLNIHPLIYLPGQLHD